MQDTHNFTYLGLSAGTLTESLPRENQFITTGKKPKEVTQSSGLS